MKFPPIKMDLLKDRHSWLFKRMIPSLLFLFGLLPSFTWGGRAISAQKIIVVYPEINAQESKSRTTERKICDNPSGGFVDVYLKKNPVNEPEVISDFSWKSLNNNFLSSGWENRGGDLIWRPSVSSLGGQPSYTQDIELPFNTALPSDISKADELQINFRHLFEKNSAEFACALNLEPSFANRSGIKSYSASTGLNVIRNLLVDDSAWELKPRFYDLKALLGRLEEKPWYYSRSKTITVVHKRLKDPIFLMEGMDLYFDPGTPIQDIYIKVGRLNKIKGEKRFNVRNLTTDEISKGRAHLEFLKILKNIATNKRAILCELSFSVPCKEKDNRIPIHSVVLLKRLGDDFAAEGRDHYVIKSRFETFLGGWGRWSIDLRELREKGYEKIVFGRLSIKPSDVSSISGVRIEKISLVRHRVHLSPLFLKEGEGLLTRWGGPFLRADARPSKVEWPMIDAYFPFSVLMTDKFSLLSDEKDPFSPSGMLKFDSSPVPAAVLKKQSDDWKSFVVLDGGKGEEVLEHDLWRYRGGHSNWVLSSDRPLKFVEQFLDSVSIEGLGKRLVLEGPLSFPLAADTRFILELGEGDNSIRSSWLDIFYKDGGVESRAFTPNQSLLLKGGSNSVAEKIRIRMDFYGSPFRINFQDLAVFRAKEVPISVAFEAPRPTKMREVLLPDMSSMSKGLVLRKFGISTEDVSPAAWRNGLKWSTPLKGDVRWIKGLHLNYNYSSSTLEKDDYSIELEMEGDNGKFKRKISFSDLKGDILIPWGDLISPGKNGQNVGRVNFFHWKLFNKNEFHENAERYFRIQAVLEGDGMQSVWGEWRSWPGALIGDCFLFPSDSQLKEKNILSAHNLRIAMSPFIIDQLIMNQGITSVYENPNFGIETIVIQSSDSGDRLILEDPINKTTNAFAQFRKFFSFLLIVLIPIYLFSKYSKLLLNRYSSHVANLNEKIISLKDIILFMNGKMVFVFLIGLSFFYFGWEAWAHWHERQGDYASLGSLFLVSAIFFRDLSSGTGGSKIGGWGTRWGLKGPAELLFAGALISLLVSLVLFLFHWSFTSVAVLGYFCVFAGSLLQLRKRV